MLHLTEKGPAETEANFETKEKREAAPEVDAEYREMNLTHSVSAHFAGFAVGGSIAIAV